MKPVSTPRPGDIFVVIPALNEADHIQSVVATALQFAQTVVVVDDGSKDLTASLAEAAGAVVRRHERNLGKGAAIITGLEAFRQTALPYLLLLDGDGQHDPTEIPAFLRRAQSTTAVVIVGDRMRQRGSMPVVRWLGNWLISRITSRLARQRIPDCTCGYRLLRRSSLEVLSLHPGHFETEIEMLIQVGRAGCGVDSLPIRTIYERGHRSHIRVVDIWRVARLVGRYAGDCR